MIAQKQGWKKGHPSFQSSQIFLLGMSGMRDTSLAVVSTLERGNPPSWEAHLSASTTYRYTTSSELS